MGLLLMLIVYTCSSSHFNYWEIIKVDNFMLNQILEQTTLLVLLIGTFYSCNFKSVGNFGLC